MNHAATELFQSSSQSSKHEVLRQRARELARENLDSGVEAKDADNHWEIVEFILGGEKYGIETSWVREVYPLRELTPLPGTPAFLPGIINVRGQILAVVDLKTFFDLPHKGLTDLNKVIIVRDQTADSTAMQIGILADEIIGVRALDTAGLQTELPHLGGVRAEYLRGVASEPGSDGPLIVLDIAAILNDKAILIQ